MVLLPGSSLLCYLATTDDNLIDIQLHSTNHWQSATDTGGVHNSVSTCRLTSRQTDKLDKCCSQLARQLRSCSQDELQRRNVLWLMLFCVDNVLTGRSANFTACWQGCKFLLCDASMLARYMLQSCTCPSVCLSIRSRNRPAGKHVQLLQAV